jgi:hypothetical protein
MASIFAAGQGAELVYHIHGMVNDKLEGQRVTKLLAELDARFEGSSSWAPVRHALADLAPLCMSGRPSLQVVMKRWALAEGRPFAAADVWRVLFAFSMVLGTRRDCDSERSRAMVRFVQHVHAVLAEQPEYSALATSLRALTDTLGALPPFYGTRDVFSLVALARNGLLARGVRIDTVEQLQVASSAQAHWLRPLWRTYVTNLPAGSCGSFTCA